MTHYQTLVTNMDMRYSVFFPPVDEFGKPVQRTKQEHPWTYDGFVIWRGGSNSEVTDTAYAIRGWVKQKM